MNGKVIAALAAALWMVGGGAVLAADKNKKPETPPAGPKLTVDSFEAKTYESPTGGKLLYRQLAPVELESGRTYPLVLFLHGAGGRGSDNVRQITDAGVCPGLLNKVGFAGRYECYMIAPQVPSGKRWVEVNWSAKAHDMPDKAGNQMRMTLELVDEAMNKYPIDPNRVYVTGLSMGGYGTWDAIQRRPKFFAAAVPVCGGGDTAQAAKLTKIPLWVWHGDSDRTVPTQRSRDMVAAIRKAGGKPIYTEQPKCGHNVWVPAYGNVKTWDWMFAQQLGKKPVPPAGPLPEGTKGPDPKEPAE